MTRTPQVKLMVTHRGGFGHLSTCNVLIDGDTPVANLWPVVVEAVRSQTTHDGNGIEKIALTERPGQYDKI